MTSPRPCRTNVCARCKTTIVVADVSQRQRELMHRAHRNVCPGPAELAYNGGWEKRGLILVPTMPLRGAA